MARLELRSCLPPRHGEEVVPPAGILGLKQSWASRPRELRIPEAIMPRRDYGEPNAGSSRLAHLVASAGERECGPLRSRSLSFSGAPRQGRGPRAAARTIDECCAARS